MKGLDYSNPIFNKNNFTLSTYEKENDFGIGVFDAHARVFDPVTPRFWSIDALSELSRRFSPFVFSNNNPLRFIDPDGMRSTNSIQKMWDDTAEGSSSTWTNNGNGGFSDGVADDVNIHGSDGKILTVKAPGPDVNINVDAKIGQGRTVDIGLKKIEDLAVGYTVSGDAGIQIFAGSSAGANITKVMFFNNEYGGYWYSYLGGQASGRIGLGVQIGANATLGIFAMVNKGSQADRFNPSQFEGKSFTYALEGNLKLGGGIGANLNYMDAGIWKGIGIGGEAGAYALKSEVNPSVTVFGYKFGLTFGGSLASAHIGGGIGGYKDENKGTFVFKGMGNIGLGAGVKFGFQFEKTIK